MKKQIRLSESQLISLIKRMVNESKKSELEVYKKNAETYAEGFLNEFDEIMDMDNFVSCSEAKSLIKELKRIFKDETSKLKKIQSIDKVDVESYENHIDKVLRYVQNYMEDNCGDPDDKFDSDEFEQDFYSR